MTKNVSTIKKLYVLTALLGISFVVLMFVSSPLIAANLGVSAASAKTVVDLINAASTVSTVISVIGVVTGVGSVGSGVAATILALIKKKGKAKAAAW